VLRRLFSSDAISVDFGLLVARVGIGLSMLLFHGWGKITGGPETWARVGGNMENLGITVYPVVWGFLAAFAESVCSSLLILGVLFRPAAFLLAFTMMVAATRHLSLPADSPASGWSGASHALEIMSIAICFLFTGPGRFSLTPRR